MGFFFSLFKNLAEVAIIPKDGLARFGYILRHESRKEKPESFYRFLAFYWNLSLKYGDLDSFFLFFFF